MFVVLSQLLREDCPFIFLVFNLILTGLTPNHGKNSPFYYLKIKNESEIKGMKKIHIKCIILRDSTLTV